MCETFPSASLVLDILSLSLSLLEKNEKDAVFHLKNRP